ncbi:hypothetical protein QE250_16170 [Chromatiaceae bacterium AAb-1]|nr:hypothetical protein [Chromatiaceae bacterium AAb-1]
MEASILDKPPLSGDFEEHSFIESGNNTLWIKFIDSEYLEWVGVFSQGDWKSNNILLPLESEGLFLVIAGGQGYFIEPNSRKLVAKTEWDMIEAITYNEETKSFLATDGLRLAILEGTKMVWSGKRVSADGISIEKQIGAVVYGKVNDLTDDGCEYSFNIKTKEFSCEWECFF